MKRLCIALAFLLPLLGSAEEIKLSDGTFVNGTIKRVDPDGLVVETNAGVEKLDFLGLAAEVQKRFGFDLAKANVYRAQQAAARQQKLAEQVASVRAQAAALDEKIRSQPTPEESARRLEIEQSGFAATAILTQGTPGGARVQITRQTGHAAATGLDKDTRATVAVGEGFIYGLEGAAGEQWKGMLYPAGYYQAATGFGLTVTIKAYALSVATALVHGAGGKAEATAQPASAAEPKKNLPGNLRGNTLLDR
jgi:hypothetical protein